MKRINKKISNKKTSQICGFCHNNRHNGYLTTIIMKEHDCLNKQCVYLELYYDHPIIEQRVRDRLKKKLVKHMMDENLTYTKDKCYSIIKGLDIEELTECIKQYTGEERVNEIQSK